MGPITAAKDAKNRADPNVHLQASLSQLGSRSKIKQTKKKKRQETRKQGMVRKKTRMSACALQVTLASHQARNRDVSACHARSTAYARRVTAARQACFPSGRTCPVGRPRACHVPRDVPFKAPRNSAKSTAHPSHVHCDREGRKRRTYKITNFLGLSDSTGKRKKQITKQTRAPRLQAPKTNIRSHLLTAVTQPKATKSAL